MNYVVDENAPKHPSSQSGWVGRAVMRTRRLRSQGREWSPGAVPNVEQHVWKHSIQFHRSIIAPPPGGFLWDQNSRQTIAFFPQIAFLLRRCAPSHLNSSHAQSHILVNCNPRSNRSARWWRPRLWRRWPRRCCPQPRACSRDQAFGRRACQCWELRCRDRRREWCALRLKRARRRREWNPRWTPNKKLTRRTSLANSDSKLDSGRSEFCFRVLHFELSRNERMCRPVGDSVAAINEVKITLAAKFQALWMVLRQDFEVRIMQTRIWNARARIEIEW